MTANMDKPLPPHMQEILVSGKKGRLKLQQMIATAQQAARRKQAMVAFIATSGLAKPLNGRVRNLLTQNEDLKSLLTLDNQR